jgi:hypothetical protein
MKDSGTLLINFRTVRFRSGGINSPSYTAELTLFNFLRVCSSSSLFMGLSSGVTCSLRNSMSAGILL